MDRGLDFNKDKDRDQDTEKDKDKNKDKDTNKNKKKFKGTVSPQEIFWYVVGGPPLIPKTLMKIPKKNFYPQKINFSKNYCASWSQNWLPGTNLGAKIGYSGTNLGAKIGYPEQT